MQQLGSFDDYKANLMVRRSRLKFDGFVINPKLQFKGELSLSNRDLSGGIGKEFSETANLILDAHLTYNFYKNLSIRFGQGKLPGNRERLISSANLSLVDRSRLNSRYTLDRDFFFQLSNHHKLGNTFIVKEIFALSQGEGKNVTGGHFGGYGYTFKTELLPFGKFTGKGDYLGGATKVEPTPKLAIAASYDINTNAVRARGRQGSFIQDANNNYHGKDLNTFAADMMFKHQRTYIMMEYTKKRTSDDNPQVTDAQNNVIGTFYTGEAINISAGYNLPSNLEISARYTQNNPDDIVANNEKEYTIGLSKYIVGHKLKIQTDYTIRDVDGGSNSRIFRFQTEVHF